MRHAADSGEVAPESPAHGATVSKLRWNQWVDGGDLEPGCLGERVTTRIDGRYKYKSKLLYEIIIVRHLVKVRKAM